MCSMRFCSIASGSSGNSVYAGCGKTNILIDAGVSAKRIEQALNKIGVLPESIDALLITHEHSDHIQGAGILARKYGLPIYATRETADCMTANKSLGSIDESLFHYISPNKTVQIKDIIVEPFAIPHDAVNPVSYTLSDGRRKIGMATDLGCFDDYIISKLLDSDALYLEANHDVNMLMVGSYPYRLKQRIAGNRGHLSNESSAELICRLLCQRLRHVVLAHMSKENNYAELAYETVRSELTRYVGRSGTIPEITVANRDIPSDIIFV